MVASSKKLPDDPEELKAIVCSKDSKLKLKDDELKNQKIKIEKLEHRISMLLGSRFGSSSESANQLGLDLGRNEDVEPSAIESQTPPAKPRKKVKRVIEPLPAHLPRETVVLNRSTDVPIAARAASVCAWTSPKRSKSSPAVWW